MKRKMSFKRKFFCIFCDEYEKCNYNYLLDKKYEEGINDGYDVGYLDGYNYAKRMSH